jgi:hypothetical protein
MSGLRESGHGWAIYEHLFKSPSSKSELHCRSEFELKLPIAEIQPSEGNRANCSIQSGPSSGIWVPIEVPGGMLKDIFVMDVTAKSPPRAKMAAHR